MIHRLRYRYTMEKRFLRKAKAHLLRFHEEHRPLIIMGLRRGGSTMVADAVSANRGIWFSNEPYAMFPGRPGFPEKSKRLFVPKHSHFFDLSSQEASRFEEFSLDLLRARFRSMGTSRRTLPGLKANRTCLKILNAPWMLPWFAEKTNTQIIALIRHPGAQARSVIRQGWRLPVEAYLDRPAMLERVLRSDQLAAAYRIWEGGDAWQRAILDWVITSYPLRNSENARLYRATYESIVRDPDSFIDQVLIEKCELKDRTAMKTALLQPSGSSSLNTQSTMRSIEERNVESLLNDWRGHCSSSELSAGQEILDIFEVYEYSFDPGI